MVRTERNGTRKTSGFSRTTVDTATTVSRRVTRSVGLWRPKNAVLTKKILTPHEDEQAELGGQEELKPPTAAGASRAPCVGGARMRATEQPQWEAIMQPFTIY